MSLLVPSQVILNRKSSQKTNGQSRFKTASAEVGYTESCSYISSTSMRDTSFIKNQSEEEIIVVQYNTTQNVRRNHWQPKFVPNSNNRFGNSANIDWRAVTIEDLRLHPLYQCLPEPQSIIAATPADYSLYRQDCWQWGFLHHGRLTTSKAASCLGFYESEAAKILGIPSSLTSHSRAISAYEHLLDNPYTTEEIINILNKTPKNTYSSQNKVNDVEFKLDATYNIWIPNRLDGTEGFPFIYHPIHPTQTPTPCKTYRDVQSIRMAWGSAQEATAVLATMNYLFRMGKGSLVKEVGLCSLEALHISGTLGTEHAWWCEDNALPPIGASPDGLIQHADGSCEVLEVKCTSPFIRAQSTARRNSSAKKPSQSQSQSQSPTHNLMISDRGLPDGIGVWHIAQLQLEILCAGSTCTGAVICLLSATEGAVLYRIRRDNKYIQEMLIWLRKFYLTYCSTSTCEETTPPEPNFFNGEKGYFSFLEKTKRMARNAERIADIEQCKIQRSPLNLNYFTS
eukprot:gene1988-3866_t